MDIPKTGNPVLDSMFKTMEEEGRKKFEKNVLGLLEEKGFIERLTLLETMMQKITQLSGVFNKTIENLENELKFVEDRLEYIHTNLVGQRILGGYRTKEEMEEEEESERERAREIQYQGKYYSESEEEGEGSEAEGDIVAEISNQRDLPSRNG